MKIKYQKTVKYKENRRSMSKKLNGFNNGRDTTKGIGGKNKWVQVDELSDFSGKISDFITILQNICNKKGDVDIKFDAGHNNVNVLIKV